MKKNNQLGFGIIPFSILIVLLGVIGFVGYRVVGPNSSSSSTTKTEQSSEQEKAAAFSKKSEDEIRAKDFKTEGKVTFKRISYYGEAKRNEIMAKIVDPLLYDYEQVLGIKLKYLTVDINDARLSYEDSHFILDYAYANKPSQRMGFMFGDSGRINYYQPQLCDDGGCKPYPEALKQKFPANYQAYLACDAAKNDKQKQLEIGCSL